jgi:hypothetical protein
MCTGILTQMVDMGLQMNAAQQQDAIKHKNDAIATAAAQNANTLLGLRAEQEQRAGVQTIYQMDLQARKADAQTRVMAGESGVAGASVDGLLADIERQRLMADQGTKSNTQNTLDQLAQQRKVIATTKQANIAQVSGSNPWATGLKIGGGFLSTAGDAYKDSMKGADSGSSVMSSGSGGGRDIAYAGPGGNESDQVQSVDDGGE